MPDTTTTTTTNNKPPPIVKKRSNTISTSKPTTTDNKYIANTHAMITAAKEKANSVVTSARDWLTPSPLSSHLESLSTVMFSPLAAHPVYRSESMVKALQLMQQQQARQGPTSPTNALVRTTAVASRTDLILHGTTYAWPSSTVLLEADIPESSPVSLFQGFASAYPSLARTTPKRQRRQRKKSSNKEEGHKSSSSKSITQMISEREKRVRDVDKISMQKSSTANEIDQINLQINELLNKRKALEEKWEKLESKDIQLQLIIEDLNDVILDIEEGRSIDESTRGGGDQDSILDPDEYESGTCFKTLQGHTDDILCLDFNHPKGMLISSSMDGTLKAWDLYRSKCLGQLDHQGIVRCLQLDEARLLTGGDDGTIKQWDLSLIETPSSAFSSTPSSPSLTATTTLIDETLTLEGHGSEITALFANQRHIVSGSNDKTIKQWDIETQQNILTLDVMWAASNKMGGSIVDSWLESSNYGYASYDYVGALQFWDFALASGTSDGKIRMWDLRTGQAHRTLPGHNGPITCLQFDQVHLVSGSLDKTIRIWDLRTGSVFDTLTYTSPVTSLQFNSNKIMSSGTGSTIDIYNRTSFQHTQLSGHKKRVNSIRFHHDVLASAGSDNVIKFWSI